MTADVVASFTAMFTAAGGEVVRVASMDLAAAWMADFATAFDSVAVGATLPSDLTADLPLAPAEAAALGISMGRGAVAETGSLILDARDGRRVQLLPPTHVVLVHARHVHATLDGALAAMAGDLPSALGLHSGPSKSADIGQILVRGVHGPGRVVAVIIE
jgi:L-lactate dehydrogenase complex protein LldG